jgi:hypothetical protein
MRKNSERGLSLMESTLALALVLIVVLASLEFFGFTRSIFLKLKNKEETREAALSALDKMRVDVLDGGSGLLEPIGLGLLEGIAQDEGTLVILSKEKDLSPLNDLLEGQTRIRLYSTHKVKKGREICIFDRTKGEVISLSRVDKKSIVLSSPLNFSFLKEKSQLLLLKKISLYLDKNKQILRRKTNSSPAQPLLEDTASFGFSYEKSSVLIRLQLVLESNKEKKYEISVFPKNMALAFRR